MEVIIIHGSKTYFNSPRWLKNISYLIAKKIIGEDPNHQYVYDFRKYLERKRVKSRLFLWNGDIWLWKIRKEAKKLSKEIEKKGKPVIIFAKSNGSIIAQFASQKTALIIKIVQVGSPNLTKRNITKIPIINIYSLKDNIQRRGIILNSILNLSVGRRKLKGGKVKNIVLNSKNHRDLNSKDMFKFYYKQIISR